MNVSITTAQNWHDSHAGALIGTLIAEGVDNRSASPQLETWKRKLEQTVQELYAATTRSELRQIPQLAAYKNYYRRFNKTYHVLLQLESVAHKGRSLPSVSPLVDAAFAAELETFLLTASHDLDRLVPPLLIDAATGTEAYVGLTGNDVSTKAGDMMMLDATGVVCTILYGQDDRTPISAATANAVYVTYCPPGITEDQLRAHHAILQRNVNFFAPRAEFSSHIFLAS